MDCRWLIAAPDPRAVGRIASAIGVSAPVASALVNRGLADPERAAAFLKPVLASLSDPASLRDMDRAAARVALAVQSGERICVHGDYDADGITGTAVIATFLRSVGCDPDTFVPDRMRDGYGIHPDRLREMAARGVRLVLAVDCGTSSVDEAALARDLGMDMVVLDHHDPGPVLPDVAAIVNPHRADCTSGARNLAAVGVAFFFCGALRKVLVAAGRLAPGEVDVRPLLDLVAVGTIADLVPITGDNRALVTAGLRLLNESPRVGLAALKALAGLNGREATTGTVSFAIAPRVNATGRMSDPRVSLDLLMARDPEEAKRCADILDRENEERRRVEAEVVADALARIESAGGPAHRAIVVASDGWHPGVVGIVASRLVEAFGRPAIVIGIEGVTGRGSCRSVRGFDMGAALQRLSDLLVRHGGHPMAAGLTVKTARLEEFRAAFEALADRDVPEEALVPVVNVDATIGLADVDPGLCDELRGLAPFGIGNPEPVFAAMGVTVTQCRRIGEDQSHALAAFQEGAVRVPGIWFRCGDWLPAPGDVVDIAFSVGLDERTNAPRLKLKDARLSKRTGGSEGV